MAVYFVTIQMIYVSLAIMQVTTSVAFWQVFRCYFLLLQVTVSVAVVQLECSAAHLQVTVSATNMCLTVFIVIMQMGVSVAIMQVVFSAVHYVHDCVCCNYAGDFPL